MANPQQQPAETRSTEHDWERIANTPEFRELMARKKRFIIPATLFFALYYFALPILTGYFEFLNTRVVGALNWAYLFALSQFFMAWIIAILYVRSANKTDQLIEKISKGKEDER
ncbi:MAG: DUF485 domain-containing protein [Planifilum sp.]|jgi:uncharacterized membrane protein (DUF485 family)